MKKKDKVAKVMGEYKRGKLKSSSGNKVKSKDQALAIAMSEARGMNAGGAVKKAPGGFDVSQMQSFLQQGGLGQAQMGDVLKAIQRGAYRKTKQPTVQRAVMAPGAPEAPKAFRSGGKVTSDGCARKGRTKGRFF